MNIYNKVMKGLRCWNVQNKRQTINKKIANIIKKKQEVQTKIEFKTFKIVYEN